MRRAHDTKTTATVHSARSLQYTTVPLRRYWKDGFVSHSEPEMSPADALFQYIQTIRSLTGPAAERDLSNRSRTPVDFLTKTRNSIVLIKWY